MAKQRIMKFRARTGKVYDVIEQILGGFVDRLDYMTRKHPQVSVSHMTIRLPIQAETHGAQAIGTAVTLLRQELKKKKYGQSGWMGSRNQGRERALQPRIYVGSVIYPERDQNRKKVR